MISIQVPGSGCKNCKLLFACTEGVLKKPGKEAGLEKMRI